MDERPTVLTDARSTVAAFGRQWTSYPDNEGYYASLALFEDLLGPLMTLDSIRDTAVLDVGSGTGRIVRMLADAGAARVTAVEPSAAFDVLRRNTVDLGERVECVHGTTRQLPAGREFDLAFAIGVLHHIPEPLPTVRDVFRALRPGGRFVAWVYGREGNEAYLRVAVPLRRLTTRLPHAALATVCHLLSAPLGLYVRLCRLGIPLPLRRYVNAHLARLTGKQRYLSIYDQLNPPVAEYYTEARARALFASAGFSDVKLHHRHGYSWSILGTKL